MTGRLALRPLVAAALLSCALQTAHAAVSVPTVRYAADPGAAREVERQRALRSLRDAPNTARSKSAARWSESGGDASGRAAGVRPSPSFRLPAPSAAELREGMREDGAGNRRLQRIGFGREFAALGVVVPDQDDLVWTAAADGGALALFEVGSPGAEGVRVALAFTGLPPGAEIRVFSPLAPADTAERVRLAEAAAALGENGATTSWLPTVAGSTAGIEIYLPPGADAAALRFAVPRVSHVTVPRSDFGRRPKCDNHVDAVCRASEVSANARNAVARYAFVKDSGGSYLCTGTLLNDLDPATQVPWFLTAQHCIDSASAAETMEFDWFLERSSCGGSGYDRVRTTGGAKLLAAEPLATSADSALVRLRNSPPAGVGLAGWSAAPVPAGDEVTTVHHPNGALKKLAKGTVLRYGYWKRSAPDPMHIVVDQREPTEGGSSGSALFRRIGGEDQVVGVLSGGIPGCEGKLDWFGRLDLFYPRISRWLGESADSVATGGQPIRRLAVLDGATGAEVASLDGAAPTIDLGYIGTASFDIVAHTGAGAPGSVRFALDGPFAAERTSSRAPHRLFGPGAGGGLPPGAYAVTATAYEGAYGTGWASPPLAGAFTVAGDLDGAGRRLAALVLVDDAGRPLGAVQDGATVTVRHQVAGFGLRARTAGDAGVGSVVFSVSGDETLSHTDSSVPYEMPATGWTTLAAGTYTVTATPYAKADGAGDAGEPLTVERFTVAEAPALAGFTLVDARGGAPDADISPVADGAVLDIAAYEGDVSIRADVATGAAVDHVVFTLAGPSGEVRREASPPFTLFGDDQGDYHSGWLPNGAYTLTATPYSGRHPDRPLMPARTVSFRVRGGQDSAAATVSGFTLVDARGGAPDADVGPVTDGAVLDVAAYGGDVSIRADGADAAAVGSVVLALSGPRELVRTENARRRPYTLFGDDGDDYRSGWLPDGAYTLTATSHAQPDGAGTVLGSATVSFTIRGGYAADAAVVTGFTLVDATGGPPEADVGAIAEGAVLDVSGYGGVTIRADAPALPYVGSLVLALEGPTPHRRLEYSPPYALFGNLADDYHPGWFADGDYKLTATPHAAGRGGRGPALTPTTVSFRVRGSPPAAVTGFTLVDARGAAPDADIGPVAEGAVLDVSAYGGDVSIRADGATAAPVESVAFELTGPRELARWENAGSPFTLFGDHQGDYLSGWLPDGAYTLTATSHAEPEGEGAVLAKSTVTFTIRGGYAADAPPVTGFTLVDARGGAPDPDIGQLADAAALDVSAYDGDVSIRADGPLPPYVGSVVLALAGTRELSRTEGANGPVALFGDDGAGNYHTGWLPNGDYRLTATGYTESGGGGAAVGARSVAFTVTGGDSADLITGFTLVDARGAAPDPDIGPVEDGAALDIGPYDGEVSIRANPAAGTAMRSIVFNLSGTRSYERRESEGGGPYALFGNNGDDYRWGWLPDGNYQLTATAHPRLDGFGAPLVRRAVRFSVRGGKSAAPTTFTLVDARDGAPEADIGPIADGAALDVSAYGGGVTIRADGVGAPEVRSVVFELSGARQLVRSENRDGAYTLFGDAGEDFATGWLPSGDYRLTATSYDDFDGHGEPMGSKTLSFSIVGGPNADAPPVSGFTLINASGGPPDPDFGPIPAGGTVEVAPAVALDVRAEVEDARPVGSMWMTLAGAAFTSRMTNTRPYALFGALNGDHFGPVLPAGRYTLTAQPYAGPDGTGAALTPTTVRFTLDVDAALSPLTGFELVDARGGAPDPVLGPLAEGAVVDVSATGGTLAIRALTESELGSVAFALDGPATFARTANGAPFAVFGERAGDYRPGWLANGTYRLVATPRAEVLGVPTTLEPHAVTFEVAGADAADSAVTGFTLIDASGPGPHRDRGAVAEGATLDLSAFRGAANIRADTSDQAAFASLRFDLRGPVERTSVDAAAAYALFGGGADGVYEAGALPNGSYTLVATPYADAAGSERMAGPPRAVSFTVASAAVRPNQATITAAPGSVAEGSPARFTVRLDRPAPSGGLAVGVSVADSGDFLSGSAPSSASFAAGASSATLSVATEDDRVVEGDGAVTASLVAGTGYALGSASSATVSVVDGDAASDASWTASFTPSEVAEGGSSTLTASVANGVTFASAQSLPLAASGTATAADHGLPASLTLAAGSSEATAAVAVADDDLAEGAESLSVEVSHGGAVVALASLSIPASDPPAVSVSAPAGSVPEGAAVAFEVSLDRAAPAGGLSVGFEVSDPDGRLAEAPPAAVSFAAGEASARVALATADDAVVSGDGSVTVTLLAGDGHLLGGASAATVTVSEDDAASWTLAVEPGAVEEGGRAALTASIGNGVAYAEDLEVSFSVAGLEAGEYALEPAAAVLAAGSSSVTAVLELLADEQAEAPGTAALAASAGGSELASATLAVVDAGAAPRVEGVPQVGAVLAAVVDGLADGEAVGYRWLRGDPDGERVPVAGATAARHALTAADVGERLSVEVARLGRTRASGATAPTWPAPANAPVGADEQELLSAELTVRSWRGRVEFAGYSRRADVAGWPASAGALSRPSLALGGAHEVDLVALRVDDDGGGDAWGLLGTTPALADGSDLTVHWNGHRIGPLSRSRSASLDWLWRGSATHGGAGVRRHFGGAADGVRVALSIRRPLPVATLTAAEKSVAEGSAAAFEVVLDRPAASATAVSVSVSGTAGALDGAPPASVTVAAGASRATLPVATADDAVVRGGGSVTATLAAGAGYRPGAESTATVTVSENDAATWSVSASPSEIAEGGSATLTVSVANGVTFAADREIALSASGTASASDYALPAALALAAGASSATASLRAVADGEAPEPAETVAVAASHGGASIGAATVTIAAHEREPSSDASLSSLALSGADIGPFDPAVTAYSATVGRDVASTRVEATPADANASVEIADASGSTAGPSRTVALSHGDNAVDATVTAEDAATARTYAVTVTREPPLSWGDRLPARDLALGPGSAPGGLWSDGEVLWVSDWWRPALSAHALADGGRVPERDVGIGSVRMPAGLHGASGTLRVVDHHGGAFGHSIADGARRPSADLSAESLESAGVPSPTGIWSDGAAAWVAGLGSARLAAFSASDGSRLASRDLELAGMVDALRPWGLWSDGEVLLVASHGSGAVRAYALSDGSRRPGRDVDTGAAGQPQPTGIWSDGAALWVADASAGTVQAYAVPGLSGAGASGPPPDPFAVRASSRAERVPAGASAGPPAAVADPALRSRIAAALGKGPGEPLGAAELASLRSLDARGAGVASLDGLQAAVNLEALDLGLNPVADLRPLASLPRLRALNLDGAPADPWPLASLPALERLSLRGAGLADAAPLAGLARLRSLDLAGSAVADVSALGGLARLAALRLDGSPVADLSPLASLPELRRLSLRGVAADPAPLAGLRLESLLLDGGAPHGAPPAP